MCAVKSYVVNNRHTPSSLLHFSNHSAAVGAGRSESNPRGFWFHFAEVEMGLLPFPLANLTLSSGIGHLRKSPEIFICWPSPGQHCCVIWPLSLVYSNCNRCQVTQAGEVLPSTGTLTHLTPSWICVYRWWCLWVGYGVNEIRSSCSYRACDVPQLSSMSG